MSERFTERYRKREKQNHCFYSGWKFITGRNEWLDEPQISNRIAKAIVSLLVGIVIGAFYFVYRALRLLGRLGM